MRKAGKERRREEEGGRRLKTAKAQMKTMSEAKHGPSEGYPSLSLSSASCVRPRCDEVDDVARNAIGYCVEVGWVVSPEESTLLFVV